MVADLGGGSITRFCGTANRTLGRSYGPVDGGRFTKLTQPGFSAVGFGLECARIAVVGLFLIMDFIATFSFFKDL